MPGLIILTERCLLRICIGMIDTYNEQALKWEHLTDRETNLDDFVLSDETKISWSEALKRNLQRGRTTDFSQEKVRTSLYRPFTKSNLYFDRMMTERVYVFSLHLSYIGNRNGKSSNLC